MKRKDYFFGAAVVGALLTLGWFFFPLPAVSFKDADHASAAIQAEGFHCTPDCANGRIDSGFVVSRQATKWEDVNSLRKAGPMGPEWKGKVWVCNFYPKQPCTVPDDAQARLWGGVYAYGDSTLLAEIENALQRNPQPVM